MVRSGALIAAACFALLVGCNNEGPVSSSAKLDRPGEVTAAKALLQPEDLLAWPKDRPAPFIIDARPLSVYKHGHIPGAVQMWRKAIARNDLPYTGMAITRDGMRHLLDSIGLRPDQTVVVYDDRGNCDAARLWWLLTVYGHPQVALLDGGYRHWQNSGQPVDLSPVSTSPSGYHFPGALDSSLVATLGDVQRSVADQRAVLLDTRSLEEHTGAEMKPEAFRAGAIPGSVLYDWGNALDMGRDQCIKEASILRAQLAALGIDQEDTVITYCHSGVRSAHTTFVLTQVLGMKHVRNYDGSWTEWSYHRELPVEVDGKVQATLP